MKDIIIWGAIVQRMDNPHFWDDLIIAKSWRRIHEKIKEKNIKRYRIKQIKKFRMECEQ